MVVSCCPRARLPRSLLHTHATATMRAVPASSSLVLFCFRALVATVLLLDTAAAHVARLDDVDAESPPERHVRRGSNIAKFQVLYDANADSSTTLDCSLEEVAAINQGVHEAQLLATYASKVLGSDDSETSAAFDLWFGPSSSDCLLATECQPASHHSLTSSRSQRGQVKARGHQGRQLRPHRRPARSTGPGQRGGRRLRQIKSDVHVRPGSTRFVQVQKKCPGRWYCRPVQFGSAPARR